MRQEGILVGPCAIAPHLHDAKLALLDNPISEARRRRGRLAGHRQRLARSFAAEPDICQPRLPVDLHRDHHVSAREHRGSAGADTRLHRARGEADLTEDLDEQRVLLEAVAAAALRDQFVAQPCEVEVNAAAQQDVEVLEGNRFDMCRLKAVQAGHVHRTGIRKADTVQVFVEQRGRHERSLSQAARRAALSPLGAS